MIRVLTCSMCSTWKVTEAVRPKPLTPNSQKPNAHNHGADLQHALHLEGDGGGEAKVQLAVQAGLAGDAAGAHHAAAPGPAASHFQDGAGRGVQAGAAAAGGGGGMATRGTPACCVALHCVIYC